jgi:hypothetical protein
MTPEDEEFARIEAEINRRQGDALPAPNCTRSHPHENMDAMCELRTEIARLTNENARLKAAQPAVPLTDEEAHNLGERAGELLGHGHGAWDTRPLHEIVHAVLTAAEEMNGITAAQPVPVKTYHDGKPWPVAPKPWVGLSEEEVYQAAHYCVKSGQSVNETIRAIEAKLKEKNHD